MWCIGIETMKTFPIAFCLLYIYTIYLWKLSFFSLTYILVVMPIPYHLAWKCHSNMWTVLENCAFYNAQNHLYSYGHMHWSLRRMSQTFVTTFTSRSPGALRGWLNAFLGGGLRQGLSLRMDTKKIHVTKTLDYVLRL